MIKQKLNILLANPRGFCAGVERAIEIVERALKKYGAPIYIKHEIVHNQYVVENLKERGAIFVEQIEDIPSGAIVIFSAHGVSQHVEDVASMKNMKIFDATCPLVKKVHSEAQHHVANDRKLILIGHKNHPEVEGTSGRIGDNKVFLIEKLEDIDSLDFADGEKLSYVTQTTLSVDDTKPIIDELHKRYIDIKGPALKDICYATQNRQNAVKKIVDMVDLLLVIGAYNSSNSSRLRDLGLTYKIESYLIDNAQQINLGWLDGKKSIGITAGASAPEILLKEVLEFIGRYYDISVQEVDGERENVKFKISKELNVS